MTSDRVEGSDKAVSSGPVEAATLNGHTSPVTFSASSLTLASGLLDGTVRVLDVSSVGSNRVENDEQ